MSPPLFPAGAYEPVAIERSEQRSPLIQEIDAFPAKIRKAITLLTPEQLDTRYKNWTIRQIVHHLADSHVNCYVRFKWTLTETRPTIKPYDETAWASLADSQIGDVHAPLALLEGVHACWVQLMNMMTEAQFEKDFYHPETNKHVSLNSAVGLYVWHCRHHLGQIMWLMKQHGWESGSHSQ